MTLHSSPARSYFLVPGHDRQAVEQALGGTTGADVVIVDLEDLVPPESHDLAVSNLQRKPPERSETKPVILCRIRAGLSARLDDIAVLPPWVAGVLLARAEKPADVWLVSEALRDAGIARSISLLLESAYAIEHLTELLTTPIPIEAIMLGPNDLREDTGMTPTPDEYELLYPRARMVFAARAAGVSSIVDAPFLAQDESGDGLNNALIRGRSLGFNGKLVLDPRHASVVNEFYME